MSTRRYTVGGVIILVGLLLCVSWAQNEKPAGKSRDGFSGKAARVVQRNGIGYFLENPEFKSVSNHQAFLVGDLIGGASRTWIPLSEVAAIEEFRDFGAMSKVYRVIDQSDKKSP